MFFFLSGQERGSGATGFIGFTSGLSFFLALFLISGIFMSSSAMASDSGDYVMTSLFSIRKPANWDIRERTETSLKISDPALSSRFCGVALEEIEGEGADRTALLGKLSESLSEEYGRNFPDFKAGKSDIQKKNGRQVLTWDYDFSVTTPTGEKRVQNRQLNFYRGPFLVTIMGSAGIGESHGRSFDYLWDIYDSFSLSSHCETFVKGYEKYAQGQFGDAVDLISMAIRKNSEVAAYHYYLGLAMQGWKGFEMIQESSRAFAKAATLDNNHIPALNQLAICFGATGQESKALSIIEDALKRGPANRESLRNRCKILINMKLGAQALKRAEEYLEIYPRDAEMLQIRDRLQELRNSLEK